MVFDRNFETHFLNQRKQVNLKPFVVAVVLKMLINFIKYGVSGENQNVPCSLSQAVGEPGLLLLLLPSWDG